MVLELVHQNTTAIKQNTQVLTDLRLLIAEKVN